MSIKRRPFMSHLASQVAVGALALTLALPLSAQTTQPVQQVPPPIDLNAMSADQSSSTPPVAATDSSQAPVPTQADASSAEIVVTGSRIRGVTATGSNVIALDQARIAEEPVSSTADLLRRVPQVVTLGANPAGGSAQNGQANVTRSAGINLRGLGNTATLLLYDGKRLPPQGTMGQVTDPSVIPTIALDRVEVVADGASAIYGSDAIAGVVNLILRKNFNGFEVRARSGVTDDGSYGEQQLDAIVGHRWDGGWLMVAGEYQHNSALYGSDLPFYQDNNLSRGGRDLRSTYCNPGTISVGGNTYAIPTGGVTAANAGSLVAGTSNKCFYSGATAVLPEQQRENVVASASQEITDHIRVFADGFYSHRDGLVPGIATFTAVIPNTNPFFVSPVAGATSVNVDYSPYSEAGAYQNPFRSYSWNVSGGVEADLFGDIRATGYYAHGESKDVADNRFGVNGGALAAAEANTDPATALNVFGGLNNPATIAGIQDNYFIITGASRLDVANLQFNGSLLTLPGGKLRFALGGEYRREYTFTDIAVGSSAGQFHIPGSGARNVKAAFGELYAPIFGPANATAGIQELSLSLAGRYERYSDFGSTANPKVGVVYSPVNGFRLRGTYGTSFRAPSYSQNAQETSIYATSLPGPNGLLNGVSLGGGNAGVKPETATTWSVGGQFQPQRIRGLNFEVTYFNVDYKNQIQALFGNPGLLTNPIYASFVTLNPSAAQVSALLNSGLPVNGVVSPNVQYIADGRSQNLGRAKVAGIDFNAAYNWRWDDWRMDAGVAGSYFTRYRFQAVPGAAFVEVVNTINFPQRFHMQADLGVARGPIRTRLTFNHLSGYDNTTIAPEQHVRDYNTVDLYLGADVNPHLTVAVEVRNLLNQRPPFVDINGGYDPQAANPLPRLLAVTAGVKF